MKLSRTLSRLLLLAVVLAASLSVTACRGNIGVGITVGVPVGYYPPYGGYGPRWY